MRVALLGMGPTAEQYMRYCAASGGRHVHFDETWTVNAFGDVFAADRVFHMDDVRIQQLRADAGNEMIGKMLAWMKTASVPIYTSRRHDDYPSSLDYPLEEVLAKTGGPLYFDTTPSYAVAYAMMIGVKELAVFGCDYDYHETYAGEEGRSCLEYWLGRAVERGIRVQVPHQTRLLRGGRPTLYGYDTVGLKVSGSGKKPKIEFTPKPEEQWPTAEQVEAAYDHKVRRTSNEQYSLQQLQTSPAEGLCERGLGHGHDDGRRVVQSRRHGNGRLRYGA